MRNGHLCMRWDAVGSECEAGALLEEPGRRPQQVAWRFTALRVVIRAIKSS